VILACGPRQEPVKLPGHISFCTTSLQWVQLLYQCGELQESQAYAMPSSRVIILNVTMKPPTQLLYNNKNIKEKKKSDNIKKPLSSTNTMASDKSESFSP
jgi:hypothetical protein